MRHFHGVEVSAPVRRTPGAMRTIEGVTLHKVGAGWWQILHPESGQPVADLTANEGGPGWWIAYGQGDDALLRRSMTACVRTAKMIGLA